MRVIIFFCNIIIVIIIFFIYLWDWSWELLKLIYVVVLRIGIKVIMVFLIFLKFIVLNVEWVGWFYFVCFMCLVFCVFMNCNGEVMFLECIKILLKVGMFFGYFWLKMFFLINIRILILLLINLIGRRMLIWILRIIIILNLL